jgi:hypothetical protein
MPRYSIRLSRGDDPLRRLYIPIEAPDLRHAKTKALTHLDRARSRNTRSAPYDTWTVRKLERPGGRYVPLASGKVDP